MVDERRGIIFTLAKLLTVSPITTPRQTDQVWGTSKASAMFGKLTEILTSKCGEVHEAT